MSKKGKRAVMRKNRGLNLPVVMDVPLEVEADVNQQIAVELLYENEKNQRFKTAYNKIPATNLRTIGDYLYEYFKPGNNNKDISYQKIAKDLDLSIGSVKINVGNLNYYNDYDKKFIPVPRKSGYIQVAKYGEDFEKWDRKKMKTITSMGHVRAEVNTAVQSNQERQKVRVKKKAEQIAVKSNKKKK